MKPFSPVFWTVETSKPEFLTDCLTSINDGTSFSYVTSYILPPLKSIDKLNPKNATDKAENVTARADIIRNIFLYFITHIIICFYFCC
jgi:hypothetical protein